MNWQKPVSLNMQVRGLGQSATLAIKERCRELRAAGRTVYDFGLGQSPFPVPDGVVAALREHAAEKDYLAVQGLPALRRAVAAYHNRIDRLEIAPENVLIGPGSKELMFVLQVVFYGEILLLPPCWVSYWPQARILGRRDTMIRTSFEQGWKVTAERLRAELAASNDDLRPRVMILNYPNNPTGLTYSADELQALAEVARDYQMIVLSDEIYGRLTFVGEHASIARYYPEGTIVASGLSKWCGAGGWRLGTFSFPAELHWLVDAMAAVASETYTTTSAPIQYAAVHAFNFGEDMVEYLFHARRVLRAIAERIVPILRDAGVRLHAPAGGFYILLDFSPHRTSLAQRGIHDGERMCEEILKDVGVAFLPGGAFCGGRNELTARLSFVDFDGGAALAASRQIGGAGALPEDFVDHHAAHLLAGIYALANWATGK